MSVEYERTDVKWDLTVPEYGNYWAEGAIHHNSGKTESHVVESIRTAMGMNPHRPNFPVPNHGWEISVSNEAQREILQPKYEKYLPRKAIAKIRMRSAGVWDQVILTNGSVIGMKSCEMDRKVFQGVALHWAGFDEEPEEDIYDEVMVRLADYMGEWWATFTPINGMSWTYDRWVGAKTKPEGLEIFTASMWDNARSRGGYIEDEEIKRQEAAIPDPIMRRIRIYGEYHTQAGRIYKSFDPDRIHGIGALPAEFLTEDGSIHDSYDTYVSIDTGRSFAAAFFLVDYAGNVFLYDEYFDDDGKPLALHARAILNKLTIHGTWSEFIIDPTSQFVYDLAEHGIHATRGDNEVLKGIEAVMDYMRYVPNEKHGPRNCNPRFYVVVPKCQRFVWEAKRYQWESPALTGPAAGAQKATPRKKDDHMMDAVRYFCVSRPERSRPISADGDNRPVEDRIRERVQEKLQGRARPDHNPNQDPWGLQPEES